MFLWQSFRHNQAWNVAISYTAIVGMMTCTAFSVLPVLRWAMPDAGTFVLIVAFVVSFESVISFRIVRRLSQEGQERTFYRASEIIVLILSIKALVELRHGAAYFVENLARWQQGFLENFFSPEYMLVAGLLALIWGITGWYAADLGEMEDDRFILSAASLEAVPSNRRDIHRALVGRVLTIGWVLIILTVIGQYDFFANHLRPGGANFSGVLLYFIFGLTLLSQTNFAAWRAAWGYGRASIPQNLARRWLLYSLAFLLVILAVALILPTSYAYSLFPTLSYLLGLLLSILSFLFSLLLFPLMFLLSLLTGLFPSQQVNETWLPANPLPKLKAIPTTPMPWWELFKSVVFWITFLLIAGLALAQYIRQNEQAGAFLRRIFRWRWAMLAWNWLRETFLGVRQNLSSVVQAGINRLRAVKPSLSFETWQFINPRRLSTRQRIIFYYMALLRRGRETGVPRDASQTPREYSHKLIAARPELEPDLTPLTDAFYDARYSQQPVTEDRANLVQRFWEHLRRMLRHRERG